jgi:hypothetical protein
MELKNMPFVWALSMVMLSADRLKPARVPPRINKVLENE